MENFFRFEKKNEDASFGDKDFSENRSGKQMKIMKKFSYAVKCILHRKTH
jgi:hypothetical protein